MSMADAMLKTLAVVSENPKADLSKFREVATRLRVGGFIVENEDGSTTVTEEGIAVCLANDIPTPEQFEFRRRKARAIEILSSKENGNADRS